jgi:uncharacterized membrane protein YqhA
MNQIRPSFGRTTHSKLQQHQGVLIMTMFADITFIEVALALVALGSFERFVMPLMPEEMVGPDGWLVKSAQ